MSFRIKFHRKPDKGSRYPCSKRDVKALLGERDDVQVSFGLSKRYELDGAEVRQPQLQGTVVAVASVDRRPEILEFDRTHGLTPATVFLYEISRNTYTDEAGSKFSSRVLPALKQWILDELAKPETSVLGIEELIVEWDGSSHRTHQVKLRR